MPSLDGKELNEISPMPSSDTYHTIFLQGILRNFNQASEYVESGVKCPDGKWAVCTGRNGYKPLGVLVKLFTGSEIKDVNAKPFTSVFSYLNPLNILCTTVSFITNKYCGIQHCDEETGLTETPDPHGLYISEISVGQENDIESHHEIYQLYKKVNPAGSLILYGVSRGAATTFNAFAKYKYPEVKLVILEACFYNLAESFARMLYYPFSNLANTALSFFTKYRHNGPSPAAYINDFPPNIPVVLITSKIDRIVPCSSTEKLAQELAARNQNEVYLLKLNNSSHPNYLYDDKNDRENYAAFIHAIYKKYGIPDYDKELAAMGEHLLETCLIRNALTEKATPSLCQIV